MPSAASVRPPMTASSTTSSCRSRSRPKTWPPSRRRWRTSSSRTAPSRSKLIPKAEALELFARKGQTLKCELIQREGRRAGPVLHDGRVHRLLPRPAPAFDREDQGVQAQGVVRQSYWKGKEGNPADAAHLRVRLLHQGRAGRAPAAARGGQAARPPPAGHGAGPVLDPRRDGRGPDPLAPQGRPHAQADRGLLARRSTSSGGYDIVFTPHIGRAWTVEDQRAHRVLQREHVRADGDGQRRSSSSSR